MELYELTIDAAHQLLKNREISSRELTRAVFDRIDAVESKVDAYITLSEELAMQQAVQADIAIANGQCSPLTGIPLGIKARKKGKSIGFSLSLGLFLLYWFLLVEGITMGERGIAPPLFSVWIPNLITGIAGTWMIYRTAK